MTPYLAMFVLACLGDVAPELQAVYCRAVSAWAPYRAAVRQVKWCEPGECAGMGGGMYHYDSRVIAIDPNWPFAGDELLLTLEHEYGHALGLEHRWGNSIMKPGWDPPFAPGPTEEDFRELAARIKSAQRTATAYFSLPVSGIEKTGMFYVPIKDFTTTERVAEEHYSKPPLDWFVLRLVCSTRR